MVLELLGDSASPLGCTVQGSGPLGGCGPGAARFGQDLLPERKGLSLAVPGLPRRCELGLKAGWCGKGNGVNAHHGSRFPMGPLLRHPGPRRVANASSISCQVSRRQADAVVGLYGSAFAPNALAAAVGTASPRIARSRVRPSRRSSAAWGVSGYSLPPTSRITSYTRLRRRRPCIWTALLRRWRRSWPRAQPSRPPPKPK